MEIIKPLRSEKRWAASLMIAREDAMKPPITSRMINTVHTKLTVIIFVLTIF